MENNYFLRIEQDKDKLIVKIYNLKDCCAFSNTYHGSELFLSKDYMVEVIKLYKCIPISLDTYNYFNQNINSLKFSNKKDFINQYGLEEYFI